MNSRTHMSRPNLSVWILPDQLIDGHPAVTQAKEEVGVEHLRVVMVESLAWMSRLPYHRKRQVLILSAGRHYAKELRDQGIEVDLIQADDTKAGLQRHLKQHPTTRLITMQSTEQSIRDWQLSKAESELGLATTVLPNSMFLVEQYNPIPKPEPGKRHLMEHFYRSMRKHFRILIDVEGKPTGGRWNFDKDNRESLKDDIKLPQIPRFAPDKITKAVVKEVNEGRFGDGVGSTDHFGLAVTRRDAEQAFDDFLSHRLYDFGRFEDAMQSDEGVLFHSVLSPYLNLGLLEPETLVRAAEKRYRNGNAPINSVEGFIRQILGWREFIYWQYHRQMPALREANSWNAQRPLPRLFWDGETEMNCLRAVISRLIENGYTHHIERLMVLCNFCVLSGIDPAAVADWFLTFYVDSHDWVVLPNVIGMGLNADGGVTATKPYIASANYINRMSDFCKSCNYRHRERTGEKACPFNTLYWNFLIEHEELLRTNPRFGPAVLGLKRIDQHQRREIQADATRILSGLIPY